MVVDAVAVVEAVEVVKVSPAATKVSLGELLTSLIRVPNTQICQMVNGGGVECTSGGGGELFSVPHPPHAHGKMSTPPRNETVTSSAALTII